MLRLRAKSLDIERPTGRRGLSRLSVSAVGLQSAGGGDALVSSTPASVGASPGASLSPFNLRRRSGMLQLSPGHSPNHAPASPASSVSSSVSSRPASVAASDASSVGPNARAARATALPTSAAANSSVLDAEMAWEQAQSDGAEAVAEAEEQLAAARAAQGVIPASAIGARLLSLARCGDAAAMRRALAGWPAAPAEEGGGGSVLSAALRWCESSTKATPLHSAAARGSPQHVEMLITAGSDVAAKAADGCAPLHRVRVFVDQ